MTTTTYGQPTRLEFTNHLMFNAILTENEDLCMRLIGAILGKHVESVRYLDDEHAIQSDLDGRGVRLDVLALIDGEYVDIEMQVGWEPDMARRCRFYHSAIATRYTPKGRGYDDVPESYVIFICLVDPLGANLPRYELHTACTNESSVTVDDGASTILLNAGAWEQEENVEVAGMLQYAQTGKPDGLLASDIARAVDAKNLDRRWVRASMGVMTYEHELIVLRNAVAKKQAELDALTAQAEEVSTQMAAATERAEAATERAEAATERAEAATAQVEAAEAQAEAATAQAEAAHAEVDSLKRLSAELYRVGRIDEYIAALDDPDLMTALKAEFAL